jgi:site-specific recombinase XerD
MYHAIITKKFIPFLKARKINALNKITLCVLSDFQDYLLSRATTAQTVNYDLKAVKRIFPQLARKGIITENPCINLRRIPVRQSDCKVRGCHEVEKLKGVFGAPWEDELSSLLCLLIYTTGMRNSEMRRLRMSDIQSIEDCRFIDVRQSKSASGVRMVPLHDFVYKKLAEYAKGRKDCCLDVPCEVFAKANKELAARLGMGEKEMTAQNITFYSGRHFWKTMMNSEALGDDIEEIFMGHKVSSNVAKLYNHKDKQGQHRMLEKTKQVFLILDTCLF